MNLKTEVPPNKRTKKEAKSGADQQDRIRLPPLCPHIFKEYLSEPLSNLSDDRGQNS